VSLRPIERNCVANSAGECMEATVTHCESNLQVLLTNNDCDLWQFALVAGIWVAGNSSQ